MGFIQLTPARSLRPGSARSPGPACGAGRSAGKRSAGPFPGPPHPTGRALRFDPSVRARPLVEIILQRGKARSRSGFTRLCAVVGVNPDLRSLTIRYWFFASSQKHIGCAPECAPYAAWGYRQRNPALHPRRGDATVKYRTGPAHGGIRRKARPNSMSE